MKRGGGGGGGAWTTSEYGSQILYVATRGYQALPTCVLILYGVTVITVAATVGSLEAFFC